MVVGDWMSAAPITAGGAPVIWHVGPLGVAE